MVQNEKNEKRYDLRVDVDILLNKYIKGRPYLSRASNLSRKGIRLHGIHEPLYQETTVGVQFQLPGDDRVITCAGKIVHHDQGNKSSGIHFTSVAPEHQRLIDDFILGTVGE